jgi:hypothetical protein
MRTKVHILKKPLLNLKDVMELCEVGYKRAKQIQQRIEIAIAPNTIINGLIPTHRVVEVMNIDVDLIIKLSKEDI